MATPVEAPKLGNTVEECLISRWVKQKGEKVAAGDVVAEIETGKGSFEVTSPVDGVLLESFFDEGALVPVFTNLFVVGDPGETVEAFRPGAAGPSAADETAPTAAAPVPDRKPSSAAERTTAANGHFSPRARRFARENNFHPANVVGSGPNGRVLEADLKALFQSGTRISKLRERIARRMRESLASTAQYTLKNSAEALRSLSLCG